MCLPFHFYRKEEKEVSVMTVDIIIPIYKPDKKLLTLLDRLKKQTVLPRRIILMNTEEKYFEQFVYGTDFANRYREAEVFHVSKKEFDHGKTRHLGVCKSDADVFVMMTQDAMPADRRLIENLLKGLEGDKRAVCYARQLPSAGSNEIERFGRAFNYPETSKIKSRADLESMGIKTFFCSNVCAAYKRSIYDELGGFVRHTIFNEDMIYAAGAVNAGYEIAYEAGARVIHSHNYTCMQQLRRNFDLGVSQAEYASVFASVSSVSEGKRYVLQTASYLKEKGKAFRIPYLFLQSGCKFLGYQLGKHYRSLPEKAVLFCTSNKEYWNNVMSV